MKQLIFFFLLLCFSSSLKSQQLMPPYDFYGDYKEIHYEHVFNTEFSQQINISDLKQIDTNTYSGKIDQKIPYNY